MRSGLKGAILSHSEGADHANVFAQSNTLSRRSADLNANTGCVAAPEGLEPPTLSSED